MPKARIQMIFERMPDGTMMPRLPRNCDGRARQPDGRTFLTLDQAVQRIAEARRAELADYHRGAFGELLPDKDFLVVYGETRGGGGHHG